MIRALVLCLCLFFAAPAGAQSPDAFLSEIWADFSNSCLPFLTNPRAAMAQVPTDQRLLTQSQSQDGQVFRRYQGQWQLGYYRLQEIASGSQYAHVSCEVARTDDRQVFSTDILETALRRLVGNGPMRVFGGRTVETISNGANEGGGVESSFTTFKAFVLEGALPQAGDVVRIEMSSEQVVISVSSTVPLAGLQ